VSLWDDLRAAAPAVDQQYQPTLNEVPAVVAAIVLHAEHGKKFLAAAKEGPAAVAELIAPPPADDTTEKKGK
jgi:hypothetical protein